MNAVLLASRSSLPGSRFIVSRAHLHRLRAEQEELGGVAPRLHAADAAQAAVRPELRPHHLADAHHLRGMLGFGLGSGSRLGLGLGFRVHVCNASKQMTVDTPTCISCSSCSAAEHQALLSCDVFFCNGTAAEQPRSGGHKHVSASILDISPQVKPR